MGRTLQNRKAFSLVEILIVALLLGIMAMIVLPKFASSADDAREAALVTDYTNIIRQIELYKHDHGGRYPETKENGDRDTGKFVERLTGRTTFEGKLDTNGEFGPYLMEWPANPFVADADDAAKIKFDDKPFPGRDGNTGWYYCWTTHKLYINSLEGGTNLSP